MGGATSVPVSALLSAAAQAAKKITIRKTERSHFQPRNPTVAVSSGYEKDCASTAAPSVVAQLRQRLLEEFFGDHLGNLVGGR